MKLQHSIGGAVLAGLVFLGANACKDNSPVPAPDLTTEAKIRAHTAMCANTHADQHASEAMSWLVAHPMGFSIPGAGLYNVSPGRIAAETYAGSDLHTHLTSIEHIDCLGLYTNSLNIGLDFPRNSGQ